MDDKWIRNVLQADRLDVQGPSLGISNDSRKVEADGSCYIWRRPGKGNVHDWKQEHRLEKTAACLDVPLMAFNEETGEKVTRFVAGLQEFKDSNENNKFERAGQLLQRLHGLEMPDNVFDPFYLYMEYRHACKNPVVFPEETEVLRACRALWRPDAFCHNDLVSGNILLGKRDYLIDYEFAGANDPRFDVASFFSENNITDDAQRNSFYKGYGAMDDGEVRLFERLADMIWANWAQRLWEIRQDPLLAQIRDDKIRHYKKIGLHSGNP